MFDGGTYYISPKPPFFFSAIEYNRRPLSIFMTFALLLVPIALLLIIHLLDFVGTSIFNFIFDVAAFFYDFFGSFSFDFRWHLWRFYDALWPQEDGGSSPWGVAAAVVFFIVLASLRSALLDVLEGP